MTVTRATAPVPVAPWGLPLVGHVPALVRAPARWLAACRTTGAVTEVRLGSRRAYLLSAPELVHEVLVGQGARFDKGGPLFDRIREVGGNGLATAPHEEHRRQRRLIQPAFAPAHIAAYTEAMREESAALTARWSARGRICALTEMHRLSVGVFTRVLLPGADIADPVRLAEQTRSLSDGIAARALFPWYDRLPVPANRRFRLARRQILDAADDTVRAARSRPDHSRLMTALLGPDADGEGFTDGELRDQVVILLAGGTETTANTLAWAFHLLARHPTVESRLADELDGVLHGRLATPDDFPALPFTRDVVLETMRVRPVVWLLTRSSTTEVELGGHRFAAGSDFVVSPYQLQHDPAVFPRPDSFDPDRWSAPATPALRQACIPFGAGRRKCVGDTFALAEITIALSAIVPHWSLRPVRTARPPRPRFRTTLAPNRLPMTTVPRR
ncbi:cytochrome P450 [Streptomyces uncialis]|uniref:Cytochrome P450 n=1 Tax=Streptomyces uncialis TaxID=1048205 RepID=A0A1Q4V385_9ACTN|nr:cytochrome P450 [Streptomyces uncialis]OKH92307.1 cytochrome P450 [Streptomyces uncialis]